MQIYPFVPPQLLSGETAPVGVEVVTIDDAEEVAEADIVAGGVKDDTVATRGVPALYQFSSGSPRHSPMVTPV